MDEIWTNIVRYEGKYMVSNFGRIKSLDYRRTGKEKIMTPQNNGNGYLFIGLRNGGPKDQLYIHRIVWEAFNGPIPEGMEINHLDENPKNNRLDNLSLVTPRENILYGNHSYKQHLSQINGKTSKAVLQYDLEGNLLNQFPSQKEAERQTGIPSPNISNCCRGKIKTTGGFYWKLAS